MSEQIRRRKAPSMLLRNAGIFNPVLVQAVGLCPVVAIATSLKNAVLLALVASVIIVVNETAASLFFKVIPRWVRIGLYMIIGGLIVLAVMVCLERFESASVFGSLGIYLPLMAVNSLVVLRCERFAVKIKPAAAFADAVTASVGYGAVMIITGAVRELLGSGSIAEQRLWSFKLPAMLLPFGGFMFLGFAAAVLRYLISVYHPKFLDKKQPKPKDPKAQKKPTPKKSAVQLSELDLSVGDSPFTDEELTDEVFEAPTQAETEEETALPVEEEEIPLPAEEETAPSIEETALPVEEEEPLPTEEKAEEITQDTLSETAEEPPEIIADIPLIPDDDEPEEVEESFEEAEDDTDSDSPVDIVDDDELAALMSRSIDDIIADMKKENAKPAADEEDKQ